MTKAPEPSAHPHVFFHSASLKVTLKTGHNPNPNLETLDAWHAIYDRADSADVVSVSKTNNNDTKTQKADIFETNTDYTKIWFMGYGLETGTHVCSVPPLAPLYPSNRVMTANPVSDRVRVMVNSTQRHPKVD